MGDEMVNSRNIFFKVFLPVILLLIFFVSPGYALDIKLQWDANSETNLAGYNIYYDLDTGTPYEGTDAQEGDSPVDMSLDMDENPDPDIVEYTLHNLPDGTYYFAVTAYNDEVPPLESDYSNEVNYIPDGDTTPPAISDVLVASKTHNSALITWTTDEDSDGIVQYGTGSSTWGSYPSNQSSGSIATDHSITLTGLNGSTTYYFRVGSTDGLGNGPTVSSQSSFTTDPTPDTTPPVVSNIQVASKTHNSAVITWTTNEQSDSMVQYGTSSRSWGSYPSNQSSGSMVTSHSVTLTGLNGGTTYYFRVGSTDASNNGPTVSNQGSFTTDLPPDTTPPMISNLHVASKTHNSAIINWTTNENSDSVVQYGTGGIYNHGESDVSMVASHSISLTGLNPDTTYNYRVFSTDASDNTAAVSGMSFTTDSAPDTTPPIISSVQVASKTHNSAVITWTTNEASNSAVQYGTSSSTWGSYPSNQSSGSMVISHSLALSGLNGSTTYYFRVGSTDGSGNGPAVSNQSSFTTDPIPDTNPPVVSNVYVASKTYNSAVITWTTNEQSNSVIQYGTGSSSWGSYPSNQSSGSMVTSHSITLTGLNGSTAYYFRVGSTDGSGNGPTVSNELSFTTNLPPDTTPPVISNVQVASKTDNSAVITWITNEQSTSIAHYGTSSTTWANYPGNTSDAGFVTSHSITLNGLNGSTTYYFRVGSTDGYGNGPSVSSQSSFITDPTPDTESPSIVQYPTINYTADTIDLTFSEPNMQNATTEANYSFSPSLLFKSLGGTDDVASIGNNAYRLSMGSVPNYLIFTLTVNNITDAAGNAVTPRSVRINDNDNDGMADTWETAYTIGSPSEDPDSDGLNNLEEYNHSTNPNDADTDKDNLPDGWEVAYGLDPNDSTGINGGDGDPDGDGWTNFEEYSNGYAPDNNISPQPSSPQIKRAIPSNNSGISNGQRIPVDTSFAVLVEDLDGVDITDTTSLKFTIDDGIKPPYERNLSDTSVVRVVKLKSDPDSKLTKFWTVYDRSLDTYGNFEYNTNVNIKVDVTDKRGTVMPEESYNFNIETNTEHDVAKGKRPKTNSKKDAEMTVLTVEDDVELEGFQVIYNSNEPITPLVEPLEEIPSLDLPNVMAVDQPVKLGPPNVFNDPVTLILPISNADAVGDVSIYLYDGDEWVYAVSSYNTGGAVQPGGDGWVVPGSLTYDDTGATPYLELQVYHFSGIQAGLFSGLPLVGIDDAEASSAGCFIDTVTGGAQLLSPVKKQRSLGIGIFLVLLCLAWSACCVRRR